VGSTPLALAAESYTHSGTGFAFPVEAGGLTRDDPELGNPDAAAKVAYRLNGGHVLLVILMPFRPDQKSDPAGLLGGLVELDRLRGGDTATLGHGELGATCGEESLSVPFLVTDGSAGPEARYAFRYRGFVVYLRAVRAASVDPEMSQILANIFGKLEWPCHVAAT